MRLTMKVPARLDSTRSRLVLSILTLAKRASGTIEAGGFCERAKTA
jgi:hypothetical protein